MKVEQHDKIFHPPMTETEIMEVVKRVHVDPMCQDIIFSMIMNDIVDRAQGDSQVAYKSFEQFVRNMAGELQKFYAAEVVVNKPVRLH